MGTTNLQLQGDEQIICQTYPPRAWYKVVGITVGMLFICIMFLDVYIFAGTQALEFFGIFFPTGTAALLTQFLFLGIIPLILLFIWVNRIVQMFTTEAVLTNQRILIKGYPRFWSRQEVKLDDVTEVTGRQGWVIITSKSQKGVRRTAFRSNVKEFIAAYNGFVEGNNAG